MTSYQFDYFDYQPSPLGSMSQLSSLNTGQSSPGDVPNRAQQAQDMYSMRMKPQATSSNSSMGTNRSHGNQYYNEIEKMKLQLNLKTQMINNLTKKLNAKAAVTVNNKNEVPSAFYNAFKATADELRLKSQECDSLSEHLESIIIANTDNHEDLTHKMIKKLNYLVQENEALMEMISNSSKSTLMIELGMCKNELTALKEKLKKYEKA